MLHRRHHEPNEVKYTLDYYVEKAKELEAMGVHILAIKDMAGLLKPYAAQKLVETLKSELHIPVHLHTHDTTGAGVATVLKAAMSLMARMWTPMASSSLAFST